MATRSRTAARTTATDWIPPLMQMAEIAVTAPWIVGYRTAMLMTGGWPPSRRDVREYNRMWTEKAEAFTAAVVAVATAAPGPVAAGKALTPVRDRVRGNARRLSRV